jgi:hypothetical protein
MMRTFPVVLAALGALQGCVESAPEIALQPPAEAAEASSSGCPSLTAAARSSRQLGVNELARGASYEVAAGGRLSLDRCDAVERGTGRVASQPDFSFGVSGAETFRALRLDLTGRCDTTLLVHDGRQFLFADDVRGLDPGFALPPVSGVYRVWAGTYGPRACMGTLTVRGEPR